MLQQADHDGVPHLVLVGRDGYYWEQALHLMNRHGIATPTGSYLHASRKVLHFASFGSLDATALEFLLTPNPALRVRDFIDRTGLEADRYQAAIRAAGFRDPDRVLTTERGGRFRHRSDRQRLVRLFQELRPQLEDLFARDRAGLESMLEQAGFDRARSALVDIGWRASSARAVARLVNASAKEPVRGYYFGTWTEAGQDAEATVVKSFFFDHGHPEAHRALIGEGVNWFEALHAAPYPPLIGFDTAGDTVTPRFSSDQDTGFSTTDHDRIWAGAAAFLEDILPVDPKASGQRPGWGYLYLVLERLLREPSAREVAAWGPLLHSEGFGLEIHEPLVQPRPARPTTANLFAAYRRSSWKRGFLASLSDAECTRLLRRIERSRRPWWQRFVP